MNLDLMRRIGEQFLETPFYGSRQMRRHLRHQGLVVGRGRVRRLMRRMELMAIYQKPKTSQPHPGHKIYPYLLRGLAIKRPDQAWCADITYVRMRRGFLYLVAVMDWHSRAVLSWRLSNTLDADFCIAALEEAMNRYGVPEIFNTDQGSQFTSLEFTQVLKDAGVAVSMDGKGPGRSDACSRFMSVQAEKSPQNRVNSKNNQKRTMAKSGRIVRCMGRVEFRYCQIEILDMHKKGYANKHLYAKLAAKGKLSLAYSTFKFHLRKLLQAKNSKSIEIQMVDRKKIFEMPHNTELI